MKALLLLGALFALSNCQNTTGEEVTTQPPATLPPSVFMCYMSATESTGGVVAACGTGVTNVQDFSGICLARSCLTQVVAIFRNCSFDYEPLCPTTAPPSQTPEGNAILEKLELTAPTEEEAVCLRSQENLLRSETCVGPISNLLSPDPMMISQEQFLMEFCMPDCLETFNRIYEICQYAFISPCPTPPPTSPPTEDFYAILALPARTTQQAMCLGTEIGQLEAEGCAGMLLQSVAPSTTREELLAEFCVPECLITFQRIFGTCQYEGLDDSTCPTTSTSGAPKSGAAISLFTFLMTLTILVLF